MTSVPAPDRQLGLLWGGVALALIALSPLGRLVAGGLPACPFKNLTGIPCPSCGTARAALALARWDPWYALTHFPLPTLAWIGLITGGLVAGTLALANRPLPALPRKLPLWVKMTIVAVVLLNWIYSIGTGV